MAVEPFAELYVTSTNLVVTEELRVGFRLWMPPMAGELAGVPPVFAQQPPHLTAEFLERDWNPGPIVPMDPRNILPIPARGRGRNVSVFTLNRYVSSDPFGGRDPFAAFGDDFFGRSLGPHLQEFQFKREQVERNGVKGWEFTFETPGYRAASQGRVTFSPVEIVAPLFEGFSVRRDPLGRARNVPAFRECALRTQPVVVEVNEPPAEGRPNSYCGAITSNLTVKASLDTSVCTAGGLLVLTLDISGASDPSLIRSVTPAKELNASGDFRLDEASLKTETLATSRRFSWRVRTLKAGTMEFPSLSVSYYDLGKRAYVTVHTESIPVQVKAGTQVTLGSFDESTEEGEANVFPLPDGIDLDLNGARELPFIPHLTWSLALFLISPVLVVLIRLAPPVRRRIVARAVEHRRATAFARCRRALRGHDESRREAAVRRFFAERYAVDGKTVTPSDARRLMSGDFPEEEVALVVDALTAFDRTNYSAKKTIVSLLLVCFSVFGVSAETPLEFTYRRATSAAVHAVEEKDFEKAVETYSDCVEKGASNPIVYSNLGGCALMAGDARMALAAYERAERWGGETETTRRGIRAAQARLKDDPQAELPLPRIFFRPHYLLSTDARLLIAAGTWAFLWFLVLVPPGVVRRTLFAVGGLVFLATVISVSTSLVEECAAEGMTHAGK